MLLAVLGLLGLPGLLILTGCTPKYDWREVHDADAPYKALMPGKPSQMRRQIQIGDQTVTMHMTAVQIDDVKFAVGAAKMSDAIHAQMSMVPIKEALLHNLGGHITHEKTSVGNSNGKVLFDDEFGAVNAPGIPAQPTRMLGRLVAQGEWVYQVIVVGPEKSINRESVDTFLGGFQPG